MRHMHNQPRFWKRPTTFLITAGMATGVLLMSPGGVEAANPTLEAIQSQISAIQSQISGLPPTWDKTLPANDSTTPDGCNSSRFTCVMGGAAVRDNETGLVWEQSPSTTSETWQNAQFLCNNKNVGNRKGWRLPTVQELASLIDPTVPFPGPMLAPGHPFGNQQGEYWSATTAHMDTNRAWSMRFSVGFGSISFNKDTGIPVWCVRGGQGVDPQ